MKKSILALSLIATLALANTNPVKVNATVNGNVYKADMQLDEQLQKIIQIKNVAGGKNIELKKVKAETQIMKAKLDKKTAEAKLNTEANIAVAEHKRNTYVGFLKEIDILRDMTQQSLNRLNDSSSVMIPTMSRFNVGKTSKVMVENTQLFDGVQKLQENKSLRVLLADDLNLLKKLEDTRNVVLFEKYAKEIAQNIKKMQNITSTGVALPTSTAKQDNVPFLVVSKGQSIIDGIKIYEISDNYVILKAY